MSALSSTRATPMDTRSPAFVRAKTLCSRSSRPNSVTFPGNASSISNAIARSIEPRDDAACDGVARGHKDDRDRLRLPLKGSGCRDRSCQNDVGLQADQLLLESSCPIDVTAGPPKVDPHVAAIGPP